jgi:hypothetical protein
MHPASVVPEADLHCQEGAPRAVMVSPKLGSFVFDVFRMVFARIGAASDSELARVSPGLETESPGVHVHELAA